MVFIVYVGVQYAAANMYAGSMWMTETNFVGFVVSFHIYVGTELRLAQEVPLPAGPSDQPSYDHS